MLIYWCFSGCEGFLALLGGRQDVSERFFASRDGKDAATPSALLGCQTVDLANSDIDLLAVAFHGDRGAIDELAHDGLVIGRVLDAVCQSAGISAPNRRIA